MTMAGFGWSVLGIDISALAIYFAHRKARRSNADVRFIRGDVTQVGIEESPFDLVLDIGCYHALSPAKRADYARRLKRSTHIGSDYLLYTWLNTGGGDTANAPTEETLRARFSPPFEFRDLAYGTDQDRTSAWILATRTA
jgi:cyclopropane fatty-acyl-phospholipid synthase-like methyltransferase